MSNPFFRNYGPFDIDSIYALLDINSNKTANIKKIFDIKDLFSATNNDITFLHSKKYIDIAKNTKATFCITTESLKNNLMEIVPLDYAGGWKQLSFEWRTHVLHF